MVEAAGDTEERERERELAEVLWRFERAHPLPSGEDVERWSDRNPRFAEEIHEYAAVKANMFLAGDGGDEAGGEGVDVTEATASLMAVLHPGPDAPDFLALMDRTGTDVDALAERLDLRVVVLERMATGQVCGDVPPRLAYRLADELDASILDLIQAIRASAARPRPGHASATGDVAPPPTYDDLIMGSDMSADRKAYWLRDD